MINDTRETIIEGGGGGWGGYGGGGIVLLVVVLIVLFAAFRGGLGGHDGHHAGNFGPGWGGIGSCFPAATTPVTTMEMAKINRDQAVDTGAIIHALDVQTCDIEKGQAAIIQNQMATAATQERTFFTEKLADMREAKLCAEAKALQQESMWAAKFMQQETLNAVNQQFCLVNNRLTRIDDNMLHRPPFYAAGGVAAVNPCPPFPFFGPAREAREGCCA